MQNRIVMHLFGASETETRNVSTDSGQFTMPRTCLMRSITQPSTHDRSANSTLECLIKMSDWRPRP